MSLPEPNEFADMVVSTVKGAIGPLLERLAAAEARIATAGAVDASIAMLRDRVVTLETKTAIPPPADPALGDLRDRVIVVETKALHPPDLSGLHELTARVRALEDRPQPIPIIEKAVDIAPVLDRIAAVEQSAAKDATRIEGYTSFLQRDLAAVSERTAVMETRAQVPGPAGKDGVNGINGTDGMGWDDLSVEHDGERAFTIKMVRGERVKNVGTFTVPVQIYRGIYTEGRTYEPGDTVTYAKSLWHCNKSTTVKPDWITRDPATGEMKGVQGKDFWKLAVGRGADGKDGGLGPQGPSGLNGKDWNGRRD